MNVNFSQNLATMAMTNFMSAGRMGSQGMQVSSMMSQMAPFANTFSAGGSFATFGNPMGAPGFLGAPAGAGAGFGQMASGIGNMMGPWNAAGNFMFQGMKSGFGAMQNMVSQFANQMGQVANMMNVMRPQLGMMNQLQNQMAQASMGGMRAQMPTMNPTMGMPNVLGNKMPGRPASFPGQVASDFIRTLPGSRRGIARALNVSGRRDEQRIQQAVGMLKSAKPKITAGNKPGGKASLNLSPADVQAIKTAPDMKTAKSIVMKAIAKKTGVSVGDINMRNKRGIRSSKARNGLNKLLGTKVRNGREKNSGSSLVLDSIAESVAKSVRGGNFGSTRVQSPGAIGMFASGAMATSGMGGQMSTMGGFAQTPGMDTPMSWSGSMMNGGSMATAGAFNMGIFQVPGMVQDIPNANQGVNVDLSGFVGATNKVAELASPLIFDLEGTGLELKQPALVAVDIDGDGQEELVTDLDGETGLLVFDSKDEGLAEITGADMFGDNTDLTHYGITAPTESGEFKDGFQALRALCEHYKLVNDSKQFLDAGDLAFLEEEVGLRMRVGGIQDGDDRKFAEIGVTEINLGNPAQTQHIDDAKEDRWGNKIMLQDGATFTIYGEVRMYADIWFKIQARYDDAPAKEELKSFSKAQLFTRR